MEFQVNEGNGEIHETVKFLTTQKDSGMERF
jgi:hypothetical protein